MYRYELEIEFAGKQSSLIVVARCVLDEDDIWYYDVYDAGVHIGSITPDHDDNARVIWLSADLITPEYAQLIGEAIERQDR
jgi:hypothetical protein